MARQRIIVIGAGAAGLMAAGQAAAAGAEVLVLEKMKRPARKLAITGKGRCNLTNTAAIDDLVARFGASAEFLRPALSTFSNADTMAFFEQLGIELETQRGGRVFPKSGEAKQVVAALLSWVEESGAYLKFSSPVDKILLRAGAIRAVVSRKRNYPCSAVILATGGASYPATGSTGDGYRLAGALGHALVPIRPALVPLTIPKPLAKNLAGLELRNTGVKLLLDGLVQREAFGELAFAAYGVTGPVILTLSGEAVDALDRGQSVSLCLDLKPALALPKLEARLKRDRTRRAEEPLASFLRGLLPAPLVALCLQQNELDGGRRAQTLDAAERARLLGWLKELVVPVTGYRPLSEAIVTAGGIATAEIEPETMASCRVRGLYVVGETLDVHGDTGGYNLQAAFSSGYLAGRAAAAALTGTETKMEKTHIPGKDAALEDTIARATALLEQHGFSIELTSWLEPVANCWSVHLRSTECPQIYTNGKGGSKLAAQASAVLEFFERLSTSLFFADYYLGAERKDSDQDSNFVFHPAERWFPIAGDDTDDDEHHEIPTHAPDGVELLSEELRSFYDPEGELTALHLRDNNTDREDRGVAALPFAHLETGETVYFPVSVLHNLYVSNGMAAGNSPSECRAQALAEVLERYVKNQVIAEGLCLPEVPAEVIARYPAIAAAIEDLRGHGFGVRIKDASLGGAFPVICVVLLNPRDGGCYASFGASARFEVALERTITELLQGRELTQLDVFQPPSHDLEAVADPLNLESHFIDSGGLLAWRMLGDRPDYPFADWDFSGSTAEEYARLKAIVAELGFDAYLAEYPFCGVYTCRIIVPGMSEIYPVDDLLWGNKSSGAALRPRLLKLDTMSAAERQVFVDDLDALQPSDEQPISDLIGVLFAPDSVWASLRVGELRAMLALAARDLDEAARWCQWCLLLGDLSAERQKLYRLLGDLLDFQLAGEDADNYRSSLQLLFGDALLERAKRLVAGEATFDGLTFGERWEDISPAHAQLLALYRRLHVLEARAAAAG